MKNILKKRLFNPKEEIAHKNIPANEKLQTDANASDRNLTMQSGKGASDQNLPVQTVKSASDRNLPVETSESAPGVLSSAQKDMVFENMSDGVITVNAAGDITYMNSACETIFNIQIADFENKSFQECFLQNKKNKAFNKFFQTILKKNTVSENSIVTYQKDGNVRYFSIKISLLHQGDTKLTKKDDFPGMLILIEDITQQQRLKQLERDSAVTFSGIIFCISIYLSIWSLIRFTLHIHLNTSYYTLMIEGMTFLLFLEILFLTSLSMRDIGLVPKLSTLKKNTLETICIAAIACSVMIIAKVILKLLGFPVKERFFGGSLHGAYTYLFTAFVQEFLARGVIQTCVKSLMKIKHQKPFSILVTSLLFSLMHLPFGFIFMMGAFALSLALGYIFERHENLWGCAFLHWSCGYIAMSLFF
ncbi:MAG: CPBP family glutamic-type intramembrane protease [Butyribacter sp.]|nr:CPBP family glutamic-type intramembrane protease [bacterium]MDY3854922.1 CPBP family glutamic-type intramembrane protease [Butyribacter sp.]